MKDSRLKEIRDELREDLENIEESFAEKVGDLDKKYREKLKGTGMHSLTSDIESIKSSLNYSFIRLANYIYDRLKRGG